MLSRLQTALLFALSLLPLAFSVPAFKGCTQFSCAATPKAVKRLPLRPNPPLRRASAWAGKKKQANDRNPSTEREAIPPISEGEATPPTSPLPQASKTPPPLPKARVEPLVIFDTCSLERLDDCL